MDIPRRPLGDTGVEVPILGLGTGPGGMGLADADATRLYHRALDLGVTYVDTAPGYRRAHGQLREVLRDRREEVFLATKAFAATRAKLLDTMARNLEELGVERVDLAYLHSLGEHPEGELFGPDGAVLALAELKRRGWARFVGFTAHSRPAVAERAIREAPVLDVVMLAVNYVERHVYGFETRVLPIATRRGLAVAAMKVYGGTPQMNYDRPVHSTLSEKRLPDHQGAFRYALSLPGVSLAVIGVYSVAELECNVGWARTFEALTDSEMAGLLERGRRSADSWGPRYGPVD